MKRIKYLLTVSAILILAACTNCDVLNTISEGLSLSTKSDDLETFEVTLETAGTLSEKLGDKKNTVQKLTIAGPIDADDVNTFRSMPKLIVLDIKGVEFIETNKTYRTTSGTGGSHKVEKNKIGEHMFTGSEGSCKFISVKIPDNITAIGKGAFFACPIESISLPDGLKTIGAHAFQETPQLSSVVIPNTVTEIGERAFFCSAIKSANIPEGMVSISDECFCECQNLTDVYIPESVTALGRNAFFRCYALESIQLPSHLEKIGENALSMCAAKSIQLPESLVSIDANAFAYGPLESIELPRNLKKLGNQAFRQCALKELTIPSSVTDLGIEIVMECHEITALFHEGSANLYGPFGSYGGNGNLNCLVYLSDPETATTSELRNIIINGVASSIVLTDRFPFHCPREFKAQKISYSKTFNEESLWSPVPGQAGGWVGLSLPFSVTDIVHKDGRVLAPFKAGVENAKPFWLRKLAGNGFENVTSIQAGEPYIIAMPNNKKYAEEYNISGEVVFSARNVDNGITIPVTSYKQAGGPMFNLNPSYETQKQSSSIYVLNSYDRVDGYNYGGIFVRALRDSYPFEAYVTDKAISTQAPGMYSIDGNSQTRSTHAVGNVPSIDDM
ncbi:leucine-rich repeat domain-containing protein [Bacteroides stercorirosoris]|uniref:leucine-rich repeat domain-containing protein n=1 Tax=Bacteroides stercorirosoris TaxID=871324 RepID=UPI0023EFFBE0|nr:leucine-rich repeat domain-containing protein [Bacteroides stercorirosoris]